MSHSPYRDITTRIVGELGVFSDPTTSEEWLLPRHAEAPYDEGEGEAILADPVAKEILMRAPYVYHDLQTDAVQIHAYVGPYSPELASYQSQQMGVLRCSFGPC